MPVKDWLTEKEAMKELKKSRATIYRVAGAGHIQKKKGRLEGERHSRTLFNAGDVERLKNPKAWNEATMSQTQPDAESRAVVPAAVKHVLPSWFASASVQPQQQAKLFLTLDEASEYSGLDRELLKRLIEEGKLKRVPLTVHWYIARASLDAFAESLK